MNKCEWKDGKFEGCVPMTLRIAEQDWHWSAFSDNLLQGINEYYFCPFCGADIRKPEDKEKTIMTKEIANGLRLTKKNNGRYSLYFESKAGVCASLDLENLMEGKKIIARGVLGWAEDQFVLGKEKQQVDINGD